jgi:pimeloyl-[acyl-carrier protein] synthase
VLSSDAAFTALLWTFRMRQGGFMLFDPSSPDFRANPYPYYHALRSADPVHFVEERGFWLLTRHADVLAALRDARLSAERFHRSLPEMQSSALLSSLSRMMLLRDPPDHTRMRTLVSKAFTPRVVEGLRARVQAITDTLLDAVEPLGCMDLVRDVAAPLPVMVIARLLGVPAADGELFKRWSDDLMLIADGSLAAEGFPYAEASAAELKEYLTRVFALRRQVPRDDLISAMLAAREQADTLSDDEVYATCVLLLIAGHETTTNLIGSGILTLLHHPDQRARVCARADLIRDAVEELLRYESPVQLTSRVTREEIVIGDKRIPMDHEVNLMLGAANRDPEVFADPDRLDITRVDNHHVAFGHGIHFCLGAALARLEAQIAVATILRRLPHLHLETDTPEWKAGIMMRSLARLPLSFSVRSPRALSAAM